MSERDALIAGRYRLVKQLGSGGMGVVWEAWDERLRRPVALKELHPQLGLSEAQAELANSRAMREARITARLHHPHAVPVFDVVEQDGQPCLIMQFLPSQSLHSLLGERGRLTPTEVSRIGAQVASALAAAHRVGIVHRDVKPGNVLIAEDGSAKISDFGISHALGDVTLTSTGMVTGTPAYLAPEVARGAESTFASDVFSLAATLYAAVEGAPPFGTHENPMALLHLVASGAVDPPTRGGALTPVLMRMLATEPEDRPSMDQVARELQTLDAAPSATVEDELPVAAAAAPTQAMQSPVDLAEPTATALPPVGEPRTGPPPPRSGGPDDDAARRRSRVGLALAGAAVLLVLAVVLGFQLLGRRDDPGSPAQPGTARSSSSTVATSSAPSSAPPSTASSSAASSSAAPPPPTTTTASQPASPAPPPSTPSALPATTSTAPPTTTSGPPTGAQLAQAVSDYYGLLPGNTEAGWSRLTPRYQSTTARNRQTYNAFWAPVQRVTVSDAAGSPPGAVQATVTYSFKDGRTVTEVTSFGLVSDGGILKIDSSNVVSSR